MSPGSFILEGDLAESWSQPNETTYIFKLRKGVRWHAKPPVNGRELTADDVKYTFDRFVNEKGNAYRSMMAALDKVEVVDKYTVKMTLKEPYVWFLDMVANPMALAIIAREAVEKLGDLKKPEAVIGTGPWMLDSYRPNVGLTFVRNPSYFLAGLPYIDKVEVTVDEDNASRMAAFIAGKLGRGALERRAQSRLRLGRPRARGLAGPLAEAATTSAGGACSRREAAHWPQRPSARLWASTACAGQMPKRGGRGRSCSQLAPNHRRARRERFHLASRRAATSGHETTVGAGETDAPARREGGWRGSGPPPPRRSLPPPSPHRSRPPARPCS